MNVPFKTYHKNAQIPSYAKEGDAGLDLTAISVTVNYEHKYIEYDTGIATAIPVGFEGQLRPRSSISKRMLVLANPPGTIDSGYRGTIRARFRPILEGGETFEDFIEASVLEALDPNAINTSLVYAPGEKVAQLVIVEIPLITPIKTDSLPTSERGTGGFGHTGN